MYVRFFSGLLLSLTVSFGATTDAAAARTAAPKSQKAIPSTKYSPKPVKSHLGKSNVKSRPERKTRPVPLRSKIDETISGATTTSSLKVTVPAAETPAETKPWAVSATLDRSNSLFVKEATNEYSAWGFVLAPSYKLNRDYKVSGFFELTRDNAQEETQYGRTSFTVSKYSGYMVFNEALKITPFGRVLLPTSRGYQAESLIFAATAGTSFEVNPDVLFSKKLGLSFGVAGTRMVHEYDTGKTGSVNSEYTFAETLGASWEFNEKIGVATSLTQYNSLSYQNVHRGYFAHEQRLGFTIDPKFILSLGHSWGNPYASSRKANGSDINFELADEQNSIVFIEMVLKI